MKAIVLDFDGVIINSEAIHYQAAYTVYKTYNIELTYQEYEKNCLGLPDEKSFPIILNRLTKSLSASDLLKLINKKKKIYIDIIKKNQELPFVADIEPFLLNAIKNNIKLAICSNSSKSEVLSVLDRLKCGYYKPYFNAIITKDDLVRGKPDPEGYLLTCSKLGLSVDDCIVVEDSPHGIDAAKKAGLYVFALLTTHPAHKLTQANTIINGFSDLLLHMKLEV